MADDDDFEWKGQESLGIRACQFQHPRGFQPQHILQVLSIDVLEVFSLSLQVEPPSAITSIAISSTLGLIAAGSFDLIFTDACKTDAKQLLAEY